MSSSPDSELEEESYILRFLESSSIAVTFLDEILDVSLLPLLETVAPKDFAYANNTNKKQGKQYC